MLNVLFGGGRGATAGVIFVAAVIVGWFIFLWGLWGEGGEGGAEEHLSFVQGLHCRAGRSCFCSQCELLFTGDFDNSGCVPSGVCVSELFNFVLCLYGEIFMHTLPSVCLMLINMTLQPSAVMP